MEHEAEMLNSITVEATSPDGRMWSRMSGQGQDIEVGFRTGAYHRYTEGTLAQQLAGLATLTVTRYRRAELEMQGIANTAGEDGTSGPAEQREYAAAVKQLVAEGASDGGHITIQSRALLAWDFRITRGAVAYWSEQEFLSHLYIAVRRLLDDYRVKLLIIKDDVYDLGYPDSLRRAIGFSTRAERRRPSW